ncbi:hypothetical protein NDU88_008645 [Pleurodeles waltl]|uniref:Uncharacterized protein n=1 Tax=Pleurodeles waltl TaxID=8319 RepID=A0AAV7NWN4_PLEWA|nr:hypothetical protein NDU88_008645 [Pleurodeles waltl]
MVRQVKLICVKTYCPSWNGVPSLERHGRYCLFSTTMAERDEVRRENQAVTVKLYSAAHLELLAVFSLLPVPHLFSEHGSQAAAALPLSGPGDHGAVGCFDILCTLGVGVTGLWMFGDRGQGE